MARTQFIECLPRKVLRDLGGAEREVDGMGFLAGKEVGEGAVVEDVEGCGEGCGGEDVPQDVSGLILVVIWCPLSRDATR